MRASWSLVRPYLLVIAAYVVATAVTQAHFQGDTIGYAEQVAEARFTDFGHFLLYPTGWVLYTLLRPASELVLGPDPQLNATFALTLLSWTTGLLAVLFLRALLTTLGFSRRLADGLTIAFILTHGFLNFAQTGTSYIPSLAFLLGAYAVLVRAAANEARGWRAALAGGLLLSASIAMWPPFVVAVAGVAALPLLCGGYTVRRVRLVARSIGVAGVVTMAVFALAAWLNGVRGASELFAWIGSSAHGAFGTTGIPRMALGLGRSLVDIGNDGVAYKRFLVGDPLNPVSLADLLGIGWWKLALVFGFIGGITLGAALHPRGRDVLVFFALAALPVLVFGARWQAGDVERYLALYPAVFVTAAFALSAPRMPRWLSVLSVAALAVLSAVNLWAMSLPVQGARQARVVARAAPLLDALDEGDRVAVMLQQDDLWAFTWSFPFHPYNRDGRLDVYHVIEPLTNQVDSWERSFAQLALDLWRRERDLWVSTRLLRQRPLAEWNWAEGSDPRVTWRQVHTFFSGLEYGESVGTEDGFRRLLPSPANRTRLGEVASASDPVRAAARALRAAGRRG